MAWSGTSPKTAWSVQLRGHSRERAWQHKLLHGSRRAPPAPCYPSKQCPSVSGALPGWYLPSTAQADWKMRNLSEKEAKQKTPLNPFDPVTIRGWRGLGGRATHVSNSGWNSERLLSRAQSTSERRRPEWLLPRNILGSTAHKTREFEEMAEQPQPP